MEKIITHYDGFRRVVEMPDQPLAGRYTGNPVIDASIDYQDYQILAAQEKLVLEKGGGSKLVRA